MAQFDVRRNRNARTGDAIPYLLELQSDLFATSRRRVVVPLALRERITEIDRVLNPCFEVEGATVTMLPLDLASVPARELGEVVISAAERGDDVVAALDLLFARF